AQALWKEFDRYDPERPFPPWACRFAYFEALRFRKKASRDRLVFREELLEILATEQEQEEPLLQRRRNALATCLGKVSPPDRELLRQRYASDQKIVDLAREQGLPVKQLYNKLDRMRARLALCIEEQLATGHA
ncbi:MAG: sigma-70 family RNA polymerase sigma factor, partial [Verrucomicrobiota bacterium]